MSRCPECLSKGECRDFCGLPPEDLQEEIERLRRQVKILKEAHEEIASGYPRESGMMAISSVALEEIK